ncbi:MAG: polyisoprenoid-binding protein YceI [Myxococcota bacterium]|jgi:polyisoprenoid-binding protein YceI
MRDIALDRVSLIRAGMPLLAMDVDMNRSHALALCAALSSACDREDTVSFTGDTGALSGTPMVSMLHLDSTQSDVAFTSYKDDMVPVSFQVHQPGGTLGIYDDALSTAYGKIIVPLEGIDSELELRDERVMSVFFGMSESNRYVTFDFNGLEVTGTGEDQWDAEVKGLVTIAGISQTVTADLHIEKLDGGIHLTSNTPLVLSIDSFNLNDNLAALIELCGHSYVDDGVEVSIDLFFGVVQ